jgi:hypothetical protein
MNIRKLIFAALADALIVIASVPLVSAQAGTSSPPTVRNVGSIKSISGNTVLLLSDAGSELTITITAATRLLRVEPGQTDLKSAVPLPFEELQSGDRILARGTASADGKTVVAGTVVAIKKEALAQKQLRELQDWQRRGTGGLVKSVDPTSGDVVIGVMSPNGPKTIVIHTNKQTVFQRYAENSIKYDDAKPGSLIDVRTGDQLRVRGSKNTEGTEFNAEDVVYGTFRNISGKILATDPSLKTITVSDLTIKKPVVVRVTHNTEMHMLPEPVAQALATRLKGQGTNGNGQGARPSSSAQPSTQPTPGKEPHTSSSPGSEGNGRGSDLQQMLRRLPPISFGEINKDDVVMIVTSLGTPGDVTAITLLNGVEPILTASPSSSITPWNLSSLGADPAGAQ